MSLLLREISSEIAKEVISQLKQLKQEKGEDLLKNLSIQINGRDPREGLNKAEEKLSKIFNRTRDEKKEDGIEKRELDDLDDVDLEAIKRLEKKGVRVIYPNLKYNKPKYQNVSEVLKYVESDKQKGEGVKLVIMNFND